MAGWRDLKVAAQRERAECGACAGHVLGVCHSCRAAQPPHPRPAAAGLTLHPLPLPPGRQTKKQHAPVANRTPDVPPPVVVAVVGPPQVGKSTLIRYGAGMCVAVQVAYHLRGFIVVCSSLVKRYTKHNIKRVTGPITVVSGVYPPLITVASRG